MGPGTLPLPVAVASPTTHSQTHPSLSTMLGARPEACWEVRSEAQSPSEGHPHAPRGLSKLSMLAHPCGPRGRLGSQSLLTDSVFPERLHQCVCVQLQQLRQDREKKPKGYGFERKNPSRLDAQTASCLHRNKTSTESKKPTGNAPGTAQLPGTRPTHEASRTLGCQEEPELDT